MFPEKGRGHLVADLDPLQINFGNGTLFYNRAGQPDPSVVRNYMINIESKTAVSGHRGLSLSFKGFRKG